MNARAIRRAIASGAVAVAVAVTASSAMGAAWTSEQVSGPTGFMAAPLKGVSCVSASFCMAVGRASNTSSAGEPLGASAFAESWDGMNWTLMPISLAGSAPELDAVSCVSASFCVAVGATAGVYTVVPATTRAVVELWNGTTWTDSPTPAASVAGTGLSGVSCTSLSSCVAVGGHRSVVLTEIWNGARWRSQDAPAVGKHGSALASVSCVSVDWCQAVGSSNIFIDDYASPGQALAEHWNGSRWSVQHAPSGEGNPDIAGSTPTRLTGVSCSSRSFCIASGYLPNDNQGSGSPNPFSLRWTGARWTTAISGLPRFSELEGVSCLSAGDCFAAGQFYTGSDLGESTYRPLAENWSGGRWVSVALPATPALVNPNDTNTDTGGLSGVSCVLSAGCSAVGYAPDGSTEVPLALGGSRPPAAVA